MKRFIVFPGLINEQYQHDSLEDARASAKAIAVTSENAFVFEVCFTFERSTDVTETSQLGAEALALTPPKTGPGHCRNGNLTLNGFCQAQAGSCDCAASVPVAQADGMTTLAVEAPIGNVDPRQGYANP